MECKQQDAELWDWDIQQNTDTCMDFWTMTTTEHVESRRLIAKLTHKQGLSKVKRSPTFTASSA